MKTETNKKHIAYYLSLLGILLLGFTFIVSTANQPHLQIIAVMLTAFFYVLWGVVHHILHHDITTKVVVEYVLIAVLGILLTFIIVR